MCGWRCCVPTRALGGLAGGHPPLRLRPPLPAGRPEGPPGLRIFGALQVMGAQDAAIHGDAPKRLKGEDSQAMLRNCPLAPALPRGDLGVGA